MLEIPQEEGTSFVRDTTRGRVRRLSEIPQGGYIVCQRYHKEGTSFVRDTTRRVRRLSEIPQEEGTSFVRDSTRGGYVVCQRHHERVREYVAGQIP